MNKIKLAMIDLDGTIVLDNNQLAKNVEQGIDYLAEQGVEIVVATGRFYDAIPDFFLNHEKINYIVSSNGALIYDNREKKDLEINPIDFKQASEIVKIAFHKANNGFIVTTNGTLRDKKMYEKHIKNNPNYVYTYRPNLTLVDDMVDYFKNNELTIKKIHFDFDDLETRNALYDQFKLIDSINTVSSTNNNIEITSKEASKGSALHYLKDYLKLSKEQVLAIGDSENDMSMLEEAGIAVAMGNSSLTVQAVSDIVTSPADEAGFYKAIKKVFNK